MGASVSLVGTNIVGKCQKRFSEKDGTIIERTDLMTILLKKNIDSYMKRQLSFLFDMILDLERDNQTYITRIKVNNDSEKEILEFIKREMRHN